MKAMAVSRGIEIAKVFKFEEVDLSFDKSLFTSIEQEKTNLDNAINEVINYLDKLYLNVLEKLGQEKASVFQAHKMFLTDPELIKQMHQKIEDNNNAPSSISLVLEENLLIFNSIDDDYFRERALDLKDVLDRLLATVLNINIPELSSIDSEVIIVAKDLAPSQTALLDTRYVKALAIELGAATSHTAIIARSLEIPCVVQAENVLNECQNNDMMIVDGLKGEVIINPSSDLIEEAKQLRIDFIKEKEENKKYLNMASITKDNKHVEIAANIGNVSDVSVAVNNGCEGVGLYRTEFLFSNSSTEPTEEEQYEAYKEVLETLENKPCVIRTIDIGGDKKLDYLKLDEEENPFLGYRAIRFCIDTYQDLFRRQLRALLRASVHGQLKIMFPMIATLDEFRKAKSMFEEEKAKLISEGIKVSNNIEVGIMIEVPAAALLAKQFAKEVDFFSIGTNDLIAYTFAADRMNKKVSYLYQPYNPAILSLIKNVVDAAHENNKWAGMCGEMASDPHAICLLVGLGLDEFSMSSSEILSSRKLISSLDSNDMKNLVEKALTLSTSQEVYDLVNTTIFSK